VDVDGLANDGTAFAVELIDDQKQVVWLPALRSGWEPLILDIRGAFLVTAAVCTFNFLETVAQVEALCLLVGDERPESQPVRSFPLGDADELRADPGASQVWIYVQLVDPITVEHQHPEDGARGSLGQPAFELPEDNVFDPAPDLILIMHERRDSAGGGA
jgi:hypothetical protein